MANSKLILGTVQFGLEYGINNKKGKPSDKSIKEILDYAYLNNINYLDTAEAYGNSQERIGLYHKNSPNKFKIITKFSSTIKHLSEDINKRINTNLNTLHVDNLYCYMFHSFKDFEAYFLKFKKDLLSLKRNKIIEKIGVSVYTNSEIEKVLMFEEIDLIQMPFNLFDNENKRQTVIEKAKKKGIEIHTRSAFLQGLFFKEINQLNGNLIVLKPNLKSLKKICELNNIKINDLALKYVYDKEYIDNVLIGVDDLEQLKSNLKTIKTFINKDIYNEVKSINVKEDYLLNPSNWKS
ncbi:aldo/keto reductase [Mesoflavibacter sp. SCSIO 43206]|uniref:aldo/keto reductase n=1 Tax=Mesoflavibacter sp. SCSIO 43206 TaxID=2779362 RepID=UPI001CA90236|nr:aldo/keto reductase [Mesoflavibacter sp. SCSIO 43206]UAB76417.1 aldo/keto reductase [Mesoflavibacter sp. SCSIO 43206]